MKPLALYILDIIGNLIRNGVKYVSVRISESRSKDIMTITVSEGAQNQKTAICGKTDFPLLKYQAEITGGSIENESGPDKSSCLTANFCLSHPQRQPLGDVAGLLTIMIAAYPEMEFSYTHTTDEGTYIFSTSETKKLHKVKSLGASELLNLIGCSINENLKVIGIADIRA